MEASEEQKPDGRLIKCINELNLLGMELIGQGDLSDKLHRITKGVMAMFQPELARIWLVKPGDACESGCIHAVDGVLPKACRSRKQCLHLIASSGRSSAIDGVHKRIPLGHCRIGDLVSGDAPKIIINNIKSDALIRDQDWVEALKLSSFAGYRILSHEKHPIGVLGCFSRRVIMPAEDAILEGLSILTAQAVQIDTDLKALKASETNYRDLFENITDFLFIHDLEGNLKEANLAIRKAFGLSETDVRNRNIKEFMPERFRSDFNGYLQTILEKGTSEGVISLVVKDGSERILEFKNSIIYGPEGPAGVRGSARDITDWVRDKKELADSEERFQQVVENAREWVWEMDLDGLYTYANTAVEKILGYTLEEIQFKKYFFDFFLPEERQNFKKIAFRSFKKHEKFRDRIYRNRHKNGEVVWLSTSGVPILDEKGSLRGYRGVSADITKQKETEAELMRMSYFDGLTGIANRRYFEDIAQREWRRALREESPLSLIMVDIDFFKNYNDIYGHLSGDECLGKVAATLKENLKRPGDMIARYGGEEFVILLPDTDVKNAGTLAEMLRHSIESLGIDHLESNVSESVTISLGVASRIPNEDTSLPDLISDADRALYRAKNAGRNRVSSLNGTLPLN